MAYDREKLIELVKRDALLFGDFTLASGRKSSYYIDCRNVTLSAAGAALIGEGIFTLLRDVAFDAVGGPSLGADPIVGAVLAYAGRRELPWRGFLVRKVAKEHGGGKLIEGPVRRGDRVVVLEDVATSGGSILRAVVALEQEGCTVVRIVTVLDRLAGASELFREKGYPFTSLLTLTDLGLTPEAN